MHTAVAHKQKLKIIYVRPSYCYWAFMNRSDNCIPPLSLISLAAYIREHVPDVEQKVIDCMPLQIGFATLERMLAEEQPDIVGVGEMTCHHLEGMRVLEIAKRVNPKCITVAGGTFFSPMAEYSLKKFPQLDFVVRYEGEETFKELVECLRAGGDPATVKGLVFRNNEQLVETPVRPLIEDLDSLPIPAYDLIPVDSYALNGIFMRKAMTIQASRGCPFGCDFCTWTSHEGEHALAPDGKMTMAPRIRLKSPERVMKEIEVLYEKYHRRHLVWTDGTWNFSTEWLDTFCSEIIRRNYRLTWFAFCRADLILEQEKAGVLEKMVRAGLRVALFGAERGDPVEMARLGKTGPHPDVLVECCRLLERKYPQVVRQATILVGVPEETPESIKRLSEYSRTLHVDLLGSHGIMPYPGTRAAEKYAHLVEEWDYSKWDMFYPVMRTETMTREEIAHHARGISLDFVRRQPLRYFKGMISPHPIRGRLYRYLAYTFARVYVTDLILSAFGKKTFQGFAGMMSLEKPEWYES